MAEQSERPNVLLVTADRWFGRMPGSAGHPVAQTPTLDVLAANGVRFSRAHSENLPARARNELDHAADGPADQASRPGASRVVVPVVHRTASAAHATGGVCGPVPWLWTLTMQLSASGFPNPRRTPLQCTDVAASPAYAEVRERLIGQLVKELYGGHERWVDGARLTGVPDQIRELRPKRDLFNQRGLH